MNKSELTELLSNRAKMSKADATRAVDALFNPTGGLIADALKKGDKVSIGGFGTFEARVRKPRTGRNPRTGSELMIGGGMRPTFRPSPSIALRQRVVKDPVTPGMISPDRARRAVLKLRESGPHS